MIPAIAFLFAMGAIAIAYIKDEMLPAHYKQTKVTFDQLSKGEQEAIERIAKARGVMLSQVQS